jgi:hypothetical protein
MMGGRKTGYPIRKQGNPAAYDKPIVGRVWVGREISKSLKR